MWWRKNPGLARARQRISTQRYRALRQRAGATFCSSDIQDLYGAQGGLCAYCGISIEGTYHIDHMMPLSRGGTNSPSNLCLACPDCNGRKYDKAAEEFREFLRYAANGANV